MRVGTRLFRLAKGGAALPSHQSQLCCSYLIMTWRKSARNLSLGKICASFNSTMQLKDIVQPKKRGGKMGIIQSIHLDFLYNRRCFLDTLNGLLFCFKFEKNIFSVKGPKNVVSICTWRALPKTQKRIVTLRERPFGNTSNAATVAVTKRDVSLLMEKIKNIFSN